MKLEELEYRDTLDLFISWNLESLIILWEDYCLVFGEFDTPEDQQSHFYSDDCFDEFCLKHWEEFKDDKKLAHIEAL